MVSGGIVLMVKTGHDDRRQIGAISQTAIVRNLNPITPVLSSTEL